jgi:hypothetical protein
MYQQLCDAAEAAQRSMNTEIIRRLGETLDPRWAKYIATIEAQERRDREYLEEASKDPAMMEVVRQAVESMRLKSGGTVAEHLATKDALPRRSAQDGDHGAAEKD